MKRTKINFTTQPPAGKFGTWRTECGWECYTDNRATAVRWFKKDQNKLTNQN